MSQKISITDKPKRDDNLKWRIDGEENQIIVLSKENLPLPLILNSTAARIFLLCDGKNSVEKITGSLCTEFNLNDFNSVLTDVQSQIQDLIKRGVLLAE